MNTGSLQIPMIKILLMLMSLLCADIALSAAPRKSMLVRIDKVTEQQLLKAGIITTDTDQYGSLLSLVRDTALVLLTPTEHQLFIERGFKATVLASDTSEVQLVRRALFGPAMRLEQPYHTYKSMVLEIDSLRRAYPTLLQSFFIGKSVRQKDIIAVKISAPSRTRAERPAILFNGCHHADELLGGEICLAIIHTLVAGYGRIPEITHWLDHLQIIVVPVINVDGHDMVTSGEEPRWRKNARDTNHDGSVTYPGDGIDLNRTYDFNWAHGGSGEVTSERYRGERPFSEPETRALASLAQRERFLLSLTYHSQGEVIYYPWNWAGHKAPDDRLLTSIAKGLAASIRTMQGDSTYKAEYGAGLVGQSYPWLYGALGTFDFVVETGKGASFMPAWEVAGIVKANLEGMRYILDKAEGPGLDIRTMDAKSGKPVEAQVWFPAIETEEVRRRTTNPTTGRYYRLFTPGSYKCIVSCTGYEPVVLKDLVIEKSGWRQIELTLKRANN